MGASAVKASSERKAAKKQSEQQYANDKEAAELQREWFLEDRTEERAYNRAEEEEARAYDRAQLDESRAYSRQVLGNLVEDAEAAGFNPLTVMRSGGASSYNAAAGLAPLSASRLTASPAQYRQAPVKQAVGGSVGGAVAGAVGDFLSDFDPFADQKKEQEYRLVESQIAALNASALSGVSRGAGSYATGAYERRLSGKGGALGKPAVWTAGDVSVTNPFQTVEVNPNASDAATWEQRYGEPGSWVGGAVVGARDVGHNIDKGWRRFNKWADDQTKPNSGLRKAARWVDDLFGLGPNKKTGRLSKRMNGGGGGW